MGRHITHITALATLVALGAAACSTGDDAGETTTETADAVAGEMPVDVVDVTDDERVQRVDGGSESVGEAVDEDAGGDMAAADPAAPPPGQATGGSSAPSAPLDLDGIGRAIAVDAGVTIATPDIRRSVDDVLDVVRRNDASVFDARVDIGDELEDGSVDGSARIVVKVRPVDLDPLIADLDGTAGTLIGRTQQSEDVTEQLVDLDIRIRVEEQTIARFESLLAEATEFQDIATIQSVITEHTIALERLLASQRAVEDRVELSTLTIDLLYRAPVATADEPVIGDDDGIADAFRSGWDAFVGALFAVGLVLAVAAPFLALAVVLLGVVWAIARRRPRRRTPQPSAAGDAAPQVSDDDRLVGPNPRG